jgi:hypothetical protein
MFLKPNCKHKVCVYLRQPTTLMGIGLTIGAFVGRLTHAVPEDVCITILSASLPLWVSERKNQIQIGAIESTIIHDIGKDATHDISKTN